MSTVRQQLRSIDSTHNIITCAPSPSLPTVRHAPPLYPTVVDQGISGYARSHRLGPTDALPNHRSQNPGCPQKVLGCFRPVLRAQPGSGTVQVGIWAATRGVETLGGRIPNLRFNKSLLYRVLKEGDTNQKSLWRTEPRFLTQLVCFERLVGASGAVVRLGGVVVWCGVVA